MTSRRKRLVMRRLVPIFATCSNKRLHQVIDSINNQAPARLLLLLCWIASVEPSRKDLLRLGLSHRQGDASIGPNRVFAQPRTGAGEPIHHQKDLAAFWGHFQAEARQAGVPVDRIVFEDGQTVDRRLGQANTRNGPLLRSATSAQIGSTDQERAEQSSNRRPQ